MNTNNVHLGTVSKDYKFRIINFEYKVMDYSGEENGQFNLIFSNVNRVKLRNYRGEKKNGFV